MANSYERFLDTLRDAGCIVEERGDRATCQAPGHSAADRSISVLYNRVEGRTAFMSFADDKDEVLHLLGLSMSDLFDDPQGARYDYGDGRVVHRTPDKKFRQSGNTKGSQLFHADRLGPAETVYVVEGEHDVLTIEQSGGVATCTAGGAGKAHLFDLSPLHGKHVVIVQDMDGPGEKHARELADLLGGKVMSLKVVAPKVGKDAADHLVVGHSLDDFEVVDAAQRHVAFSTLEREFAKARSMPLIEGVEHLRSALARVAPAPEADDHLKVMSELVDDWLCWVDTPAAEGVGRVLSTPWPDLDRILAGGLHAGRSYLIAARPGAGKSLGLTNFAATAAATGAVGLLYSVEMSGIEITSRIIAARSEADYGQITRRQIDSYNWDRIATNLDHVRAASLYVSDRSAVTISRIANEARQVKAEHGLDFIAIDYMQLLKSPSQDRQKALTEISREIKVLAGELDVAIISACQLNRGNAKEGRKPMLSDLRESGAIEQDADVAILLHHPELADGTPTGEVEFIVAKNRTGPSGSIMLPWRPHFAKIGADFS